MQKIQDGDNFEVTANNVNGLTDRAKGLVIMLGIDSLTAGSGAASYHSHLERYLRGIGGFGGRYVPFMSQIRDAANATNFPYFQTFCPHVGSGRSWVDGQFVAGTPEFNRSIGGLGVYFNGTQPANSGMQMVVDFPYHSVKVFYRQTPGGGTFEITEPATILNPVVVDTDGEEALGYVEVFMKSEGAIVDPYTTNNTNWNLTITNVTGVVQIHGATFLTGNNGVVLLNPSRQGRRLFDYISIEEDIWEDFMSINGVTDVIFNAGMNDSNVEVTPEVFESELTEAVSLLINNLDHSGKCIIVKPNQNSTNTVGSYDGVYPSVAASLGTSYVDTVDKYGTYSTFSANGWMDDSTHPNNTFYKIYGRDLAALLSVVGKYEEPDTLT